MKKSEVKGVTSSLFKIPGNRKDVKRRMYRLKENNITPINNNIIKTNSIYVHPKLTASVVTNCISPFLYLDTLSNLATTCKTYQTLNKQRFHLAALDIIPRLDNICTTDHNSNTSQGKLINIFDNLQPRQLDKKSKGHVTSKENCKCKPVKYIPNFSLYTKNNYNEDIDSDDETWFLSNECRYCIIHPGQCISKALSSFNYVFPKPLMYEEMDVQFLYLLSLLKEHKGFNESPISLNTWLEHKGFFKNNIYC